MSHGKFGPESETSAASAHSQFASVATQDRVALQDGPGTEKPGEAELRHRIEELGDWFHNLNLHGVETAPNHFLGDFPNVKWKHIGPALPDDLAGASVLDIGCNAGFYSIELKRRGAGRVLGIDVDDRYLRQAHFAASTLGLDIEFEKRSVYAVNEIPGKFDIVIFMGVLYHLRYPLFALDRVVQKVGKQLVFQTMLRGSEEPHTAAENYHFWNKKVFEDRDFPRMHFIEQKYADDPTNWWIPNRAAAEALLRSSGMKIVAHPETETWICAPDPGRPDGHRIQQLELAGLL